MAADRIKEVRDHLMKAAAELPDVCATGAIESEAGVFGIEFDNGDELFVDIKPA